jgi:hypothetical protein
VTVLGPDGTAVAHGCSAGQHPWTPDPPPRDARPPDAPQDPGSSDPPPSAPDLARLSALVRRLNVTLRPVARGTCDHAGAGNRYTPSRALKHLVRARSATCTAPGCQAQAIYADLDHTVPYPDGPTCQCNLGPKCRTHHRCKQAPGWLVEQPEPGVFRWTLPSGRTRTTRPTVYDQASPRERFKIR